MNDTFTNPRSAAIIGFILALPFAILFSIARFNIEPFDGQINTLFTAANGIGLNFLGKAVLIGTLLLLPLALVVSVVPIVRNVRAGNSILVNPVNLLLAAAIFALIATLVIGFIVDQYPCWIGVPNCD